MNKNLAIVCASTTLLSACISLPQTPAEVREAGKTGSTFFTLESIEVQRPFPEVARTFAKKAPECLEFALTSTSKPVFGIGSQTSTYAWGKPTLRIDKDKAELHFQGKFVNMLGKVPPDGWYYMVADAYPLSKNKTKVDIYWARAPLVVEAVKGWATGENLGCPDPTQIF
ncbi:MAG TPA: hypothetical protein VFF81_06820 [Noviherbaspirillum sp.]|nr:hypothetical protein [Noviherbaspirillum sp.]